MAGDEAEDWTGQPLVVAVDAAGRGAFWPAARPLPEGWRPVHGPCDRAAARAWIAEPGRLPDPPGALRPAWGTSESVPARLARLAAAAPQRPAILFGAKTLTRGDLDARARAIAAALIARGVGPGDLVAVALERGPLAVAAYLGVLRAGAAYLPLDPAYPVERVHTMLADAGIRHCLTLPGLAERLELPADVARHDTERFAHGLTDGIALPEPAPDAPAYLIYTSGSTGRPKGVLVEHGPLAEHCRATAEAYEMGADSRELHVLSFAFDGAHERWMTPLMAGGCIALRGPELWTAADTLAAIRRHRVTHAGLPTSYIGQLAEWAATIGEAPAVAVYSFGGEAMSRETFRQIAQVLKPRLLINGYGPTECVISPLVWKVAPGTDFPEPYAPIGRPVGDRSAYVLGPDLEPVPEGETGELYIGGLLARGYLGRPDETAERFLPDPFRPGGGRMYRTGDRARIRPDGTLSYAGRTDDQVKIRGHRIEIGEVEAALRSLDTVADAVVVRREGPGGARLAAYVTPARGRRPEAGRLRAALARHLPNSMIPASLSVLPRLPVTPNGKVDRRALPDPSAEETGRPPGSATERRLAAIWSEVLGYCVTAVDRPFLALGGDSLSALRLLGRLRLIAPQGGIGVADLLRNPTIAELAARIDAGGTGDADGLAPLVRLAPGRPGSGAPLLVLFPGLLVSTREYEPLVAHLGPDRPACGFLCASLAEAARPLPAVADLAEAYAVRVRDLMREHACCVFLGWSWGGVLAYETARRLGPGFPLDFVGMLDACGLEANFAPGAGRPIEPAERQGLAALVTAWLARSPMRAEWEALRARMDPEAAVQFGRFLAAEPQPLPTDGPEVGSRERILWTLVDHALQFRALRLEPGTVPIRSFEASDSRARGLPIIDWGPLTPNLLSVEVIPETDHLDIVLSPALHARIAALTAPAAVTASVAAGAAAGAAAGVAAGVA